jgi:CHASE3 domain sensor protein
VLDVVDGLYISVQNADVAERDYIITGDDSHLDAFKAALKTESEDSEKLRTLLVASKTQEANLAKIDVSVAAKLSELSQTIALRQQKGFEAAQNALRAGDDRQVMASLREQVSVLAENERRFLLRRQAASREHERDTLLVGIFIAALSVTVRILIALGIRHVHSKRRPPIAEGEDAEGAGDPAARPKPASAS